MVEFNYPCIISARRIHNPLLFRDACRERYQFSELPFTFSNALSKS
jgi:hypothetical protein